MTFARCLVCDDHVLVREALVGTITMAWPGVEIRQAGDFASACSQAAWGYDLCICDLVMPGATPLEGIERLSAAAPDMPILVVTGTDDDVLLVRLLQMGVAGFINKSASSEVLKAAIGLILAGGRYLPPRLAELSAAVVDSGPSAAMEAAPVSSAAGSVLTARQCDVLACVAQGLSNKEIARALAIAPSTVKSHLDGAMRALDAGNRAQAAAIARAMNLI